MPIEMDPAFASLPLGQMADAALTRGRGLGAEYVAFRLGRTRHAEVRARDGKSDGFDDDCDTRFSVRVLCDGSWGLASSMHLSADEVVRVAESAVHMAAISRPVSERITLAEEPVYANAVWISSYKKDPFAVSESAKFAVLSEWCGRLLAHAAVDHVYAKIKTTQENRFYADSAGTTTVQQRVRIYPQVTAIAISSANNSFEAMRTVGPPSSRGWEYVLGDGWDWDSELAQLPELLAEKKAAPSIAAGEYDLVIAGSNLWLTIHETIGHATELDRVLGHEAAYAGTSFVSGDGMGMCYGSPLMNVIADRTAEHGLATIGYDDEGVAAQQWSLVRQGRLVGYQLNRSLARLKHFGRSNGCALAATGSDVPVLRMPNVSLLPLPSGPTLDELIAEVPDGVYVAGDKSWSIDMQRRNFQFTGQRFLRIRRGRLAGQVRHLAYQSNTTDFWNSLSLVGGPSTYHLYGADYCGKAQPIQIAAASHGSPAALFRKVSIVNAAEGTN
jgi:TldD protein